MPLSVTDPRPSLPALLRKSAPYVAPFRRPLLGTASLALLIAGVASCEPLLLKCVIDLLADASRPGTAKALAVAVAGFVGIMLLRELLAAALDARVWRVRLGVHFAITRAVVERLHALPLTYHRAESAPAIVARMDRGITGAVAAFAELAFGVAPSLAYLVVSVGVMVKLDWRLSIVALAFTPVPPLVARWASREQTARERDLLDRWTSIFARFNEVLSAIVVVKSFAMEDLEKRRFLSAATEANAVVERGVARDAKVNAVKNMATALARISGIAAGGLLVLRGEISLGTMVAFLGYIGAMFAPVQGLTGSYQTLQRGSVALEAVFEVLDAEDAMKDAPDAVQPARFRGDVELRDVSFGYGAGKPVLQGIQLRARRGETIALVGPSGGGKSTLMTLVQRLYDPTHGAVLIDGVDVRRMKQRALREQVGVVLQDPSLFSGSIRDNIAFGRPSATRAEIEAAARAAHAHDFIVAQPEGYDTRVGDRGACLSGGQRQRIAIARALLKNAPILILDEATSALDAESELLVQSALERLRRGRTTFVIAHRLSTVTSADRIFVLRDGRVSESGTHRELVSRDGYYASLVRAQTLDVAA